MNPDRVFRFYQRTLAGFGLILFAVTWKLWTPQTVFPQIPFLEFLVDVPGIIDWIGLTITATGLLVGLTTNSPIVARWANMTFALGASSLILLDQHRLQPWAYQFVIFSFVMAAVPPRRAMTMMRWIVISIYLYSAVSKFDYQFVHTIGNAFLTELARLVRVDVTAWSMEARSGLILAFPLGELLVGIALAIPKTRRIGVVGAIGLHSVLILILGPLGLGHQPGVLVWNLFFIAQAVLLFGRPANPGPTRYQSNEVDNVPTLDTSHRSRPRRRRIAKGAATGLTLFVLLFPLTRLIGICDHWPAWEVYAPRCSRVEIPPQSNVGNFEEKEEPPESLSGRSLSALGVPIYPQSRFQLGVAIAIAENQGLDREMRVILKQESDRWTGARETRTLTGIDQMKMAARQFWLNMTARSLSLRRTGLPDRSDVD